MLITTDHSHHRAYIRACTQTRGWCLLYYPAVLWLLGGPIAGAEEARPLMRDFIGINGHTVQFKPDLYQPVCRLVRDYHPVEWDLGTNSAELPAFPFAKNRVDWSKVYGSWRAADWTIDACLMFESLEQCNWRNIETDARAYGELFARQFGPSGTWKLVESVEIGNEPGKWSDADYSRMFRAMAEGLRAGDPRLKIATCNLTTGQSGDYEKSIECIAKLPELFDVLAIHTYAQLEGWPTWRRSFPEDPDLPRYLQDVEALCRWRDEYVPEKPVWITEFGYDASTKPSTPDGTFAEWKGVTDQQQAQWLVRSLLVFSAMPVERAYIYFFNDEDKASVHASSGLTRHFQPKPSYHSVAHLQRMLGDYRFQRVVTRSEHVRVQAYGNESNRIVWVVWSPTGSDMTNTITLDHVPGKLVDTQAMPMTSAVVRDPNVTFEEAGRIVLQVTESPTYLIFEKP